MSEWEVGSLATSVPLNSAKGSRGLLALKPGGDQAPGYTSSLEGQQGLGAYSGGCLMPGHLGPNSSSHAGL